MAEASAWSTGLPTELLEIILSRLDLADHARFSFINQRWRSVAAENPATNKPLSLVRSKNPRRLIRKLMKSFLESCRGSATARFIRKSTGTTFVGCFGGWLVVRTSSLKLCRRIFLINPGVRVGPVQLPSLHIPGVAYSRKLHVWKVALSSPPFSSSSRDKCVIVLIDLYGMLYFCNLGDTAYTRLDDANNIIDIVFCKDQLCAVNLEGRILVFDFGLDSREPVHSEFPLIIGGASYLANASDKVLVIAEQTSQQFLVLELDPATWSCTPMESLGENILFISSICSFYLPAKDYPDFQPNHLYASSRLEKNKFDSYSFHDKTWVMGKSTNNKHLVFFTLFHLGAYYYLS